MTEKPTSMTPHPVSYLLHLEALSATSALFVSGMNNAPRLDLSRDQWEEQDRPSRVYVLISTFHVDAVEAYKGSSS